MTTPNTNADEPKTTLPKDARPGFTIADQPSTDNIPSALKPLVAQVVMVYRNVFGSELDSVYVHGSASRGDWQLGKSDLDMVGIIKMPVSEENQIKLDRQIAVIAHSQTIASMIEAPVFEKSWLSSQSYESDIVNLKLVLTAVCVWGQQTDFMHNLPDTPRAFGRYVDVRRRRVALYRSYDSEAAYAHEDRRKITRQYAKQAIRTLNLIAVMRGAALRTSLPLQLTDIAEGVPEAIDLGVQLKKLVTGEWDDIDRAVDVLDASVRLYGSLYPIYSD